MISTLNPIKLQYYHFFLQIIYLKQLLVFGRHCNFVVFKQNYNIKSAIFLFLSFSSQIYFIINTIFLIFYRIWPLKQFDVDTFFSKKTIFYSFVSFQQKYNSISTFFPFLSFYSQIYNSISPSSYLFSIEFGHQSTMILTLFCRHKYFFLILSFSS